MKKSIFRLAIAGLVPVIGGVLLAAPLSLCAETGVAKKAVRVSASPAPLAAVPELHLSEIYGFSELAKIAKNHRPISHSTGDLVSFVVLGEVNCPGDYELESPVDILSALLQAGGPTSSGSMRRIEIYKDQVLLDQFDLYDLFNKDHRGANLMLNGGEQVVIPLAGSRVKVSGEILRPGIFETKPDSLQLAAVIGLSGGFIDTAAPHRVEILRKIDGYRRVFLAIELESGEKLPPMLLMAGDEVHVVRKSNQAAIVTVEGQVVPCKIIYKEGLRLSEILQHSAKFSSEATCDYAEVLREGAASEYEVIGFSPSALLRGDRSGDITMRPGDRVVIFSKQLLESKPLVFVEGHIKKPGMHLFESGLTIKQLIDSAGGIKDCPKSMLAAELSRRDVKNGRLEFTRIEINLVAALSGDPRHNLILKPFDSLRITGSEK